MNKKETENRIGIDKRNKEEKKPAAFCISGLGVKCARVRFLLIALLMASSVCMTGCVSSIYENADRNALDAAYDGVRYDNMTWHDALVASCYDFYMAARHVAPIIIIVSIVFGAALFALIRKYKALRRVAVFVFMIGIPLVTFVAVYGMAILLSAFR